MTNIIMYSFHRVYTEFIRKKVDEFIFLSYTIASSRFKIKRN